MAILRREFFQVQEKSPRTREGVEIGLMLSTIWRENYQLLLQVRPIAPQYSINFKFDHSKHLHRGLVYIYIYITITHLFSRDHHLSRLSD